MTSGVQPELDPRLPGRSPRRRARRRGLGGFGGRNSARRNRVAALSEYPGVIEVDASTGEVMIDLRTIEERANAISLVTDTWEESPPTVNVVPRVARNRAKRVFDVTVVTVTAPLWGPVVLALAGLVRLTSRGPAFYRHERVGRFGRPIVCIKLRTMVVDADTRLADLLASDADLAEEFARNFKLKEDPRVTRFGRLLRRTSIDELPQLVNVLRGEMSLVGPRPIVAEEMRRYGQYISIVLSARPGITGLWQVSGRNDIPYPTRVALDVQYAFGQSVGTDVEILGRTVTRVLRPSRSGGY
jgi:lipopolysaccharide/colanic/teichoic acid biosynthesis glycosyltransferase